MGEAVYKFSLPDSSSVVHLMFHVSSFQKDVLDESHVLSLDSFVLALHFSYEVEHIDIFNI